MVTVSVTLNIPSDDPKAAMNMITQLEKIASSAGATTTKAETAKSSGTKKASKSKIDLDEETTDEDLDLASDDGDDLDVDTDEEETSEYTIDDVLTALRAYSKKYSREKAAAVLKKFNVKSVKDLEEAQYEKVMAILKK